MHSPFCLASLTQHNYFEIHLLHRYTIIYLSFHLFIEIWVNFSFELLQTKLSGTFVYETLYGRVLFLEIESHQKKTGEKSM